MPIHLWFREVQTNFRGDIEATEFRPLLPHRYIVARHTRDVLVRYAGGFLRAQIAGTRKGLCQGQYKNDENDRSLTMSHIHPHVH
jgi:hypothetical protein